MAKSNDELTLTSKTFWTICMVRLVTSARTKARCDKLIVEHHYLKDATLVGEQFALRGTYKGQWLALALERGGLSSEGPRGFIGWDFEQCRRRRSLLATLGACWSCRSVIIPI